MERIYLSVQDIVNVYNYCMTATNTSNLESAVAVFNSLQTIRQELENTRVNKVDPVKEVIAEAIADMHKEQA